MRIVKEPTEMTQEEKQLKAREEFLSKLYGINKRYERLLFITNIGMAIVKIIIVLLVVTWLLAFGGVI